MTILLLFLSCSLLNNESHSDKEIILDKLNHQVQCWNSGDINCFMEDYWLHDSLMYIGKNGVTYGWQETLDNYKIKYPTQKEMGILTFHILKSAMLDEDYFLVVGKWHLSRDAGEIEGHFSLIWKKINNNWVIIADHSS